MTRSSRRAESAARRGPGCSGCRPVGTIRRRRRAASAPPPELVHELVMKEAHEHEVVIVGRPAVLPVPDVMGLQIRTRTAPRKRAPVISELELAPEPLGHVAR